MNQITLGIDGMACGMCEAHVNDTIRKNFTVKKVTSKANKGSCVILTDDTPTEEEFKAALDPTGYRVISYDCQPYEKKGLFRK